MQEQEDGIYPSRWPTTLGVVCIVFGALGMLYSASQLMGSIMMTVMGPGMAQMSFPSTAGSDPELKEMEAAMEEMMGDMMTGMTEMSYPRIAVDSLLILIAIGLLVGGILLVKRKRIAAPVLQGWAYAKLVVGLFGIFLMHRMMSAMSRSMGEFADNQIATATTSGGSAPVPFSIGKMYSVMFAAQSVFMAIWLAILPVIVLIWLNRSVVKNDIKQGPLWS